jgi:hypothetical protein
LLFQVYPPQGGALRAVRAPETGVDTVSEVMGGGRMDLGNAAKRVLDAGTYRLAQPVVDVSRGGPDPSSEAERGTQLGDEEVALDP